MTIPYTYFFAITYQSHNVTALFVSMAFSDEDKILIQEITRRWDSERELFYDDIVHV